jgi:hypothetical protein
MLVALGSIPGVSHAQVSIGAVLGVSRTGLSGDKPNKTSYSTRAGPIAGLVLEIPVAKNVAIVFQPGYRQSGANIAFDVPGQEEPVDSLSLRLDYVSLPILLKVITDGGRWYVTSGVDLGWLTSATLSTVSGSQETDVKDALNDFDLAVIFGVGRMFPVGRPRITAEIRYSQSLANLAGDSTGQDLPARFRASGFQLLAGVLLPLGGQR